MKNSLVSIILPVYNGENYLKESIESVFKQSYENWELILIDDASTDNSKQIIESYIKVDQRVKGLFNKTNLGLPRSLNKGFLASKGAFLTWTSDDNRFLPNFLEILLVQIFETQSDFVYSDYWALDKNGVRGVRVKLADSKLLPARNVVGASFLYSREVYNQLGDYSSELVLVEDYDYWLRVYEKFKMVYCPQALYEYRFHDQSLTHIQVEKILNQKKALHRKFKGRLKMGLRIRGLMWIYHWYLEKGSLRLFGKAFLGALISFDLAFSELWKNRVKL